MPFFLNPRFALLLLVGLPLAGGAAIHPQGVSAFVMGAWAGTLVVVPPLFLLLWALGLRTIGEILRPLVRLPILIAVTIGVLYLSDVELGLGSQLAGGAGLLWWLRRRGLALFA